MDISSKFKTDLKREKKKIFYLLSFQSTSRRLYLSIYDVN